MKGRVSERLWAAALAGGLTAGALGCFLAVYPLPVRPALLSRWVLLTLLFGLLVLPLRRGSELTVCVCALGLGYLLHRPETVGAIKTLLYLVSFQLDESWHWGYFVFPGLTPGSVDIPLCLYGCALTLGVCRSMLRRRTGALPMMLAGVPVILSAMVPGKRIPPWTIFLLLSCAALLLLTGESRKNGALQGIRLSRTALLPVCLCVGLLLVCNPQESYVDRAGPARERILEELREVSRELSGSGFIPRVERRTDLSALTGGERPKLELLAVTAPESGPLYLRGQDYDTYTGREWTADPQRIEHFDGWGEEGGAVLVETFGVKDTLYLPYYPGAGTVLVGGVLENTGAITAYAFPTFSQGSAMGEEALERFLTLPESTRSWAEALLPENAGAGEIAALVAGSGVYDLDTPRMPEGAEDFVRWFLEEAHRGYCVHFASAATVLLRAAGIPARYVTGFLQEVTAGEKTVVTARQAHAWTEYYDGALGAWRILDATPAAASGVPTPTQRPAQSPTRQDSASPREAGAEKGTWLVWLLLPGAGLLLLVLRRWLSRWLWEYRKKHSDLKRRVLLLWQEAEGLAKATGREIPEELLELAQKARFSQHRITAMDAVPLEDFCASCRERLREAPWGKRLAERWIYNRI